jgi:hypothetical protein
MERAVDRAVWRAPIGAEMSTSDLCKTFIQPATVPPGWACEPERTLFDDAGNDVSAKGWYKHCYVKASSGLRQPNRPPQGTRSMCSRLASDPATARFIGRPTHFFSHAWLQKFANNADALRAFVAARPAGSPEAFFWYDCFAIDQHECQYPRPGLAQEELRVVVQHVQGCHRFYRRHRHDDEPGAFRRR